MLKQGYNITNLNSTQEKWEKGVMREEESKHKELKERERSNRTSNNLS
jgi:hypothetical protein